MNEAARNLLHLVGLFEGLDVGITNEIGDTCRWRKVPANQHVLHMSDRTDDVYFVTDGKLAATIFSAAGKEVNYLRLGRGDIFGEFAALDGSERSASIVTLRDSVIAAMSARDFRQLIITHPTVGLRLASSLVAKNRDLTNRILEYSTLPVPTRVARELLRIADAEGDGADQPKVETMPTHYQIASRISTNREAVSRTVSLLSRKGVIEMAAHAMRVLDLDGLRRHAELSDGAD